MKTLYSTLLDVLSETKMFEHAMDRKFVLNRIFNNSQNLVNHLLKTIFFPNDYSVNHWEDEVVNVIEKHVIGLVKSKVSAKQYYEFLIAKQYSKGKNLSIDEIYRLFRVHLKTEYTEQYMKDFDSLKSEYSSIILENLKNFFTELSELLETKNTKITESELVNLTKAFNSIKE
ncbi:gp116 [Sphingomonas phage PAU]|uniref:gp116 n=1 Tax=Sphingomonas phage PAU TaxID=1150991 RepID=UPI0002573267|nr:gp116 [Sphingomonas phage PAU]AFF28114.1 gp116 [Sphingomonas phage PAU]